MSRSLPILIAVVLAFTPGCKRKPDAKEITSLQRKEAALAASEASFAISVRDYARAEGLLAKATETCPDTGDYWISLGSVRKRLGNAGGAKDAYQKALECYEADAGKDKADAEPWLNQVNVLALLGRVDDARNLLEKTATQFPNDRDLRVFIDTKQLDRLMAEPNFKESAL